MKKEIKCKKCGLPYEKKLKECPYCHKKRPNRAPIIILLIAILAIITIGIFTGNLFNKNVKYIDGLKIEYIKTEKEDTFLTTDSTEEIVNIYFEITNISTEEKSLDFDLSTYADNYKVKNYWLSDKDVNIEVEHLIPGKKCVKSIVIYTEKEWNKIEVYYSDNNKDENYKKLFTINNS